MKKKKESPLPKMVGSPDGFEERYEALVKYILNRSLGLSKGVKSGDIKQSELYHHIQRVVEHGVGDMLTSEDTFFLATHHVMMQYRVHLIQHVFGANVGCVIFPSKKKVGTAKRPRKKS